MRTSYGIIEGLGSYVLTELGKMNFYPVSEQDVNLAKLRMLSTPSVFSKLVKRSDGEKLPSTAIVKGIDFRP